jgi:tRNA(fMet)-specific endonuclease VapC
LGTLLDSSVLIRLERSGRGLLAVPEDEEVGIAAITAAELLHGVLRANAQHRSQRAAFVEHALETLPVLPFDLTVARVHARLWADLASSGRLIGPHDLIIAATALASGWLVATHNVSEFSRVPALVVREPGSSLF